LEKKVMNMFKLIRPDAINVLESENVKKALPRYRRILLDREKAKFIIARKKNLLRKKIEEGYRILKSCELCERKCHANRAEGKIGICKVGKKPILSSAFQHLGEEPFFVPSFTIFFMGCPFHCQYCQNYTISQWYENGHIVTVQELAEMINDNSLCRNVNFVGGEPTPHLPFILDCLQYVKSNIPTVWNSNFFMSEQSMEILKNVIDVYLSDWKYGNNECAERLSKVKNYLEIVQRNHDLAFKDSEMVIRHLVLPNHFECCTKNILTYIADTYGKKVIVNIMDQYRPVWKAHEYADISRRLTYEEFKKAVDLAVDLDLNFIT
jgi:putative pyruvate formate lyase activating enzyme